MNLFHCSRLSLLDNATFARTRQHFWKSVAQYLFLGFDTRGYPCQRLFNPQKKGIFYHGEYLFYYAHG
jgi:hypothetical protein